MLETFLEILGGFFSFVLATLLAQAVKHIVDKTFDKLVFWRTNIKPLFWSLIAGVVIAAISVFAPNYTPFVEVLSGGEIDTTNMTSLFLSASILGTVFKSIFGKPTEEVKAEIALEKLDEDY